MPSFDTSHLMQWLTQGASIMALIQGLKNFFPAIFEKTPQLARIIAAVAALVAGLIPCIGTTGIDANCVVGAVFTFLTAIGVYHSVAQSGGAVQPPLPPAAKP